MIIEVKDLTKQFGEYKAVDSVSFTVEKGEIFAFLGPNGAGKTTTIKMLTTLLEPTAGHVLINSFDPVTQKDQTRRSFGIVFQDNSLDDELTAYENMEFHGVLYGVEKSLRQKRIQELLTMVELWDRRKAIVKTFSGGMRRRLEIARGLLHHPKIFFLDEPTLGLDPQTRNHIWDYIKGLNKKEDVTIFFTTHYMQEAADVATRVAIIDHGKIIDTGTPKELMKRTKTDSLEKAFLALTGTEIRSETSSGLDEMRMRRRLWR